MAPPRSAKPPFRPLAPSASSRASWRTTRSPPSASASAQAQPVIPPPTTATLAGPGSRVSGRDGLGASSQYGRTLGRRLALETEKLENVRRRRERRCPRAQQGVRPLRERGRDLPGYRQHV